jgi:outer membrane protein OmpA-like peptidoglycan-associated protein
MNAGTTRINFMPRTSGLAASRAVIAFIFLGALGAGVLSLEFEQSKIETAGPGISTPVHQPEMVMRAESKEIVTEVSSRVLGMPGVGRLLEAGAKGILALELRSDDFFQVGTANLQENSLSSVRDLAVLLRETFAEARIEIEAHTDESPVVKQRKFFPSNWELSAARAASLLHVFERAGFRKERLKIVAFGDSRPVASDGPANRRLVVRVSYPDQGEGG